MQYAYATAWVKMGHEGESEERETLHLKLCVAVVRDGFPSFCLVKS